MSFIKTISHLNTTIEKINLEIELQTYISNKYDFCPKILNYKHNTNNTVIIMEDLNEKCIADKYSDDPNEIPDFIWNQIRQIISILLYEEGIEYIDITPYNFIEINEKVYIIDFGHAYWIDDSKIIKNWFLKEFFKDDNEVKTFNPDFL